MDNPPTPAPAPSPAACAILPDRGVLAIQGPDRHRFLQGLVSNDIAPVSTERAVYTAFLTPQGKYLHDFFVVGIGDALYLDAETERSGDLLRRLKLYKLRAQISLEDVSTGFVVAALFGAGALSALDLPPVPGHARPLAGGAVYADPRLSALGARAILPRTGEQPQIQAILDATGCNPAPAADYDRHRLALGVPDGSRDLVVEKAILLENNLDALNAISWDKGCYMGQELTARTRYRGLVRKRLFPVDVEGPLPEAGTAVMIGDREVGEMRSGRDGRALALLRLEEVDKAEAEGTPLTAGAARIIPRRPDWVRF